MSASSKGFIISDIHIMWILNVVKELALENHRDFMSKFDNYNKNNNINYFNLLNNNKNQYIDIILSLQIRKSYGGMKCDMRMIEYFSSKIYNKIYLKFDNDYWKTIDKKYYYNPIYIRNVKHYDIINASVDFHCTNIIDDIKKKFPYLKISDIRSAIWFNRSSLNYKLPIYIKKNKYYSIWQIIEKYTDKISYDKINKLFR
jgi:hypothetical protein